jgi:hypothetical protein
MICELVYSTDITFSHCRIATREAEVALVDLELGEQLAGVFPWERGQLQLVGASCLLATSVLL